MKRRPGLWTVIDAGGMAFERLLRRLRERGGAATSLRVDRQVKRIVARVRRGGDRALVDLTRRYDGVRLRPRDLLIGPDELRVAERALPRRQARALKLAARRIAAFHRHQLEKGWMYRDGSGFRLGQKVEPLERVGVYVPGGTAAYPSSVLMNVIPARVAGVREIVVATPPRHGGVPLSVRAAAAIAGASALYQVGGAQAIAALAFGTESVPRVDKICGPGNIYVTAAKRMIFGQVDIDMVAGPSEVLVVADSTAKARLVAVDLLAQAEHDRLAASILVTTSSALADRVTREVETFLQTLPRRRIARQALERFGAIVLVGGIEEAAEVVNRIAPEHLQLMVEHPGRLAGLVRHAGAIFVGSDTPVALGDYIAGPSHVLPTAGTARFSSPLGVYDFFKRSSVVQASRAVLEKLGRVAAELAEMEGLGAHALAVYERLGYN